MRELHEISDWIVQYDPVTLQRIPVSKSETIAFFRSLNDLYACRVIDGIPSSNGYLNEAYVDHLMVRVHCEMQRLSEEFQHGWRVRNFVASMVRTLAASGVRPPYRVVDIGCGTGYVIRWIAAHGGIPDTQLVGVDMNRALVEKAQQLAKHEHLECQFAVANAFHLETPATLLVSTAVLHHFRGDDLASFFKQHDLPALAGFVHFDFQPTFLARPGAWLFHFVRMREPLAKHDGVISARRAHHANALLRVASGSGLQCGMFGRWVGNTQIPRVFQAVVGLRPDLLTNFQQTLGAKQKHLEIEPS